MSYIEVTLKKNAGKELKSDLNKFENNMNTVKLRPVPHGLYREPKIGLTHMCSWLVYASKILELFKEQNPNRYNQKI